MKFLAILKDSFREAIDAKVFYVMVGLSLLVTLVGLTLTFTPTASGERVMQLAVIPLSLNDEDMAAMTRDPQEFSRRVMGQATGGKRKVAYQLVSTKPADGAPDAPTSPFQVIVSATYLSAAEAKKVKADPAEAVEHIRQRFGAYDNLKMVDAAEVRQIDKPDGAAADAPALPFLAPPSKFYFEVTTRPTPATTRFWWYEGSLFFGGLSFGGESTAIPLFMWVYVIEAGIVAGFGAWVTILISVVLTSFFVPNMLRKGTVDMLMVKPIRRTTLLLYKYIGGLTFIFLNTTLAIGGVWIALGLRSGQWPTGFLVMILVITFFFAILYSVSTLAGVLTRSAIVAILATCAAWFLLFMVGFGYSWFERARERDEQAVKAQQNADKDSGEEKPQGQAWPGEVAGRPLQRDLSYQGWFAQGVYAAHYVLPRTADIDKLSDQLLLRDLTFAGFAGEKKETDAPVAWAQSLTVSFAFIAVMLGLACWRFSVKDY